VPTHQPKGQLQSDFKRKIFKDLMATRRFLVSLAVHSLYVLRYAKIEHNVSEAGSASFHRRVISNQLGLLERASFNQPITAIVIMSF
jgi:hypothetical protein